MNLSNLLDTYVSQNRKITSKQTVKVYRIAIRQFASAIGENPTLQNLSNEYLIAFERWLDSGTRSVYTVNERVARIKALWRFAAKRGLVADWPQMPKLAEPEPEKPTLSVDQVGKLLTHISELRGWICGIPAAKYYRAYHLVLWDSAERSGTLRKAEWSHLHSTEDGDEFHIPAKCTKDGTNHYFPISTATSKSLREIKYPERDLIFPWETGCWHKRYKQLIVGAGLPYIRWKSGSHRIRRTVANIVRNAGGDASDMLNHTNGAVTKKFYLAALSRENHPNRKLPKIG